MRLLPIAVLSCAALIAAASLWSRATGPAICTDVPCNYLAARTRVIEGIIAQRGAEPSYLALGDSIVEMADLPVLCGLRPINAGIGWATTDTFATEAKRLAGLARPRFAVLALGTNDALQKRSRDFKAKISAILASLAPLPVIVVPVPPGSGVKDAATFNALIAALDAPKAAPLDRAETMEDGIHLTAATYARWSGSLADAAGAAACPG